MTDLTRLTRYQDPLAIQRVLHTARTIAIVGLSGNELRASYFVGYYLKRHGYRVIPVNPREREILGETSYPSLLDVPVPVDLVNVFRAPDALPGIAHDAVEIKAGALWCQFGVINEEGAGIAEDGGLTVIMDRCLKIEHARYLGRMHWLGFNTQRITSVRTGLQLGTRLLNRCSTGEGCRLAARPRASVRPASEKIETCDACQRNVDGVSGLMHSDNA
jgi:predicted CoA-binding protein